MTNCVVEHNSLLFGIIGLVCLVLNIILIRININLNKLRNEILEDVKE